MPQDLLADYIICYDIVCPKRSAKIHRIISAEAFFLQRSAYYLRAKKSEIEHLLFTLADIIDSTEDDIRIYPIHQPLTSQKRGYDNNSGSLSVY